MYNELNFERLLELHCLLTLMYNCHRVCDKNQNAKNVHGMKLSLMLLQILLVLLRIFILFLDR